MSSSPATARIACASPLLVERAIATELDDWLAYFEPDVVLLAGESAAPRAASVLRRHLGSETVFFQPAGNAPASGPRTINGVQFVFAPTTVALEEITEREQSELEPDDPTYVLSGLLDLDVDTTTLIGREEYRSALDPSISHNPTQRKRARKTIRIGVVLTDDVEFTAFGEKFVELMRLAHYRHLIDTYSENFIAVY